MAKTKEVYILLDLGTPTSPLVAVYSSYTVATEQRDRLQAANSDTPDSFIVEVAHIVQ